MPAITCSERDLIPPGPTNETTARIARGPTASGVARQHVRGASAAHLSAGRASDLVLLTSELVTNAVEYLRTGPIDVTVVRGAASTRIEVSNPNETWANAPAPRSPDSDQVAGRGLFLVEQLSDRWGTSDADCTVWFELDHRSPARPTPNDDIRSDGDRRKVSVSVAGADERRRPAHRRGGHNDAWWWS